MRAINCRTTWDYSSLAQFYELRAPYHPDLIAGAARSLGIPAAARIADIGAGTGRLAAAWAALGFRVDAVEPCREMRQLGRQLESRARWHATTGERTGLAAGVYHAVSFGSSLNVVDASAALAEAARVLRKDGALVVVYNHRRLEDPMQRDIEQTIRQHVPEFSYGERRRNPSETIESGGVFRVVETLELAFSHETTASDFAAGFRAHATLQRQAGPSFPVLLDALAARAAAHADASGRVQVPFVSRAWLASRC
ncbi:MAG: methyltransferase domain-containing protein [Wenzhouxiangellaceae bacterium]|nr:methyltransferase domain-containing protein [Wenzhouxiangellaceae bacterium]